MENDASPIRFTSGKEGYYRDESKTKPSGTAGKKDFGSIISKDQRGKSNLPKKQVKSDEESSEDQLEDASLEEESSEALPVSVFEMSKKKVLPQKPFKPLQERPSDTAAKSALPVAQTKSEKKLTPYPDDAGKDIPVNPEHISKAAEAAKKAPPSTRPFDLLTSAPRDIPQDKTSVQKEKSSTLFGRQQPDLAAVNPLAGIPQNTDIHLNLNMTDEKPVAPVKSMQELINIMVKEAQSMEAQGKTDTTITLKHPPIFEGAQLVVTSFSTARGEFNISFENLSQAAQNLISMQDNRASLLHALELKGYQVHILSATTMDEQRTFTANVEDPRRDRNQEDRGEQSGGQRGYDEDEA